MICRRAEHEDQDEDLSYHTILLSYYHKEEFSKMIILVEFSKKGLPSPPFFVNRGLDFFLVLSSLLSYCSDNSLTKFHALILIYLMQSQYDKMYYLTIILFVFPSTAGNTREVGRDVLSANIANQTILSAE